MDLYLLTSLNSSSVNKLAIKFSLSPVQLTTQTYCRKCFSWNVILKSFYSLLTQMQAIKRPFHWKHMKNIDKAWARQWAQC